MDIPNLETLESDTRDSLRRMLAALEEFRDVQPDITGQAVAVFLMVASAPGSRLSMTEISERLGMAQASASRNVANLAKVNRHKKPGLDLLKQELDPADFRRKVVTLTERGERLARRIAAAIESETAA